MDSVQRSSGVSKVLKGVYKADLLSVAYPKLTSCIHVILDINEFKSPTNANGFFGVINNFADVNSNVAYRSNSFYQLCTNFENPFDLDRLTVAWRDPTGNTITMNDNSFLLKISHSK